MKTKLWDGWESTATAEQRDRTALAYLRMFKPDTYGIAIPHDLAIYMEQRQWIKWVPPKFGSTLYEITESGRSHLAKSHDGRVIGKTAPVHDS